MLSLYIAQESNGPEVSREDETHTSEKTDACVFVDEIKNEKSDNDNEVRRNPKANTPIDPVIELDHI